MDRKTFKNTPQTLIKDARSGDIKKIIHPADTEIGISELPKDLIVHGTISGSIHQTSDGLSYLVGGTNVEIRSGSNGQLTISAQGASGASSSLSYVTIASEATLSAERVLTGGTGLKITDGGANSNVTLNVHDGTFASLTGSNFTGNTIFSSGLSGSLQRTSAGISYLVGGTNVTIASSSNGQVTISAAAASGAPSTGQYLTLATDPTLLNERVFVPSTGLKIVDGGANGNYTISVHDGTFAALSGSNFTGNVKFQSSVSGSIQKLSSGESYLVGGSNITVSSASNGQITISTTNAAPQNTQYLTLASDSTLTDERVLSASNGIIGEDLGPNNNYSLSIDNRVVATLSGSTFHGPIEASAAHGITGSITQIRLIGGTLFPFISAPYGNSITVTTGSFGEIVLSGSGGGGGSGSTLGGGDPGAQYLVLANTASLSNERAFVASTGLKTVDAGANGNYTLSVHDGTFAALSGSVFSGTVSAPSLSGSLTRLSSGLSALVGIGGTQIISQSNGQIWISSSAGGSGGGGAAIGASYLQLSADGTNAAERVFTPSTGLVGVDNGSNSSYVLSINDNVVATLSGSTFTGPVILASNGGITGSLTRLVGGTPFITSPAGNIITITTGSLGQIIISGSGDGTGTSSSSTGGGDPGAQYLVLAATASLSNERVLTPSTGLFINDTGANGNYTIGVNDRIFAGISGSTFTGPVVGASNGGFTGSLTRLAGGTPFVTVPAGNVITVSTGTLGQIIISGSGGTPQDLSLYAPLAGATFTGPITAVNAGGITGSITRLVGGNPFITSPAGNVITVTTGSNGQIILSGSGGSSSPSTIPGGDPGAQYLVLATTASLSAERTLVPSTGLFSTDAGANGNFTLGVNDRFFAALTGSVFTGVLSASGGISGSIQQVAPGLSYIVGGTNVVVTSASNGQITISGTSFAPLASNYLTVGTDATLTNERSLVAGTGLRTTDAGAGSTFTFFVNDSVVATLSGSIFSGTVTAPALSGSHTRLTDGTSFITGLGGITVTSASNGQITISGSLGNQNTYAPPNAQYITLATDATLTSERVFVPSVGLKAVDAGANGNYTLSVHDGTFAALSGSNFSGPVLTTGGLSGSLQKLVDGTSYLVGIGGVTITSQSNGQIFISASSGGSGGGGASIGASYLQLSSDATNNSERVFTPSVGLFSIDGGANSTYTLGVNDRIFAALTGSVFTGVLSASAGISGSIQQVGPGLSYLVAQGGITITSSSNGQITISGSLGNTNTYAPPAASYITIGSDATLTNERSLTAGTGIILVDAGANSTATLSIRDSIVATISGSTFTGPVVGASNGGFTGSLTRLAGGTPFITVPAGNMISITTGSLGQIILSGSGDGSGSGFPPDYASLTGSTFTGRVTANATLGFTGSLTQLVGGTPFITADAANVITIRTGSNGQIIFSGSGGSGGSGAPTIAQYLTLATDATLTAERVLVPSTGLFSSDTGANGNFTIGVNDRFFAALTGSTFSGPIVASSTSGITGSITQLVSGAPFVTVVPNNIITISTGSGGQIILSGNAGSNIGAPASAQFLTLATDSLLSVERVFTPGTGLKAVDAGAGSTYTLNANDNVLATLSGSTFTGPIVASSTAGITGSITTLVNGTPFITAPAGNVITISTGSNGQIILSGSGGSSSPSAIPGGDPGAQYLTLALTSSLPNERLLTPSTGLRAVDSGAGAAYTLSINDNVVATISGSTFTGAVTGASNGGFTGSLTRLVGGSAFITSPAGNVITITTGSGGQIILSGSGGSTNSGAPANVQYLTLATDATLTAERVLVPSTGLKATDAGANGNYTLTVDNGIVATLSGSTFSGPIIASATSGITGSHTQLVGGAPFITALAGNVITVSTGSGGQIILSGSGGTNTGAPASSQFLTLAADSLLTSERVFTPSTGIKAVDSGAGAAYTLSVHDGTFAALTGSTFSGIITAASNGGITGSITRLVGGTPFITVPAGNIISITTGSLGQIILSGTGDGIGGSSSGGGGDPGAQYLTLALTASLPNERVFTPSTGIRATDAGAGSTYTLSINNGVVATISGSAFTGNISAPNFSGAHTGSHTLLSNGTSAFIGVGGITITTGSLGQVLISGTVGNSNNYAPPVAQYLTLATDATLTAERVFVPSTGLKATDAGANGNYTLSVHDGTFATISGSTFTGPVIGASNGGFTGSLTRLTGGTPFITVPAGNIISITTGSLGQIILSGTGDGAGASVGGSGGGDPGAQYLVLAATASLPNERVFTAGAGISVVDAGAGGAYTVNVNDRFFAGLTGSVFTGVLSASGGISGSIQRLGSGLSYLVGAGGTSVVSQSNGQIIISSSLGSGTPGGNSGTIQINASGSFSGSRALYYDLFNNRAATGPAGLEIGNPAGTFGTVIKSSATTADRIATIPLTTTSDTFVMLALNQTLTTKTLTSPTINTPNFGANAIVSTGEGRFGRIFTSGAIQIGARTTGESALVPTEQVMWVSGSRNLASGATRRVAVFGGDVISSGSFQAPWISGSIQKTNTGLSYLVGIGGTSIISQSNGQIWISSSIGGGAGSVPTGTGFRHITANSEDGTAKLVVNADVDAAAAIVGTKIDPDFGSQTVQTANNIICGDLLATSFIELGSSARATTGEIRLANSNKMVFRNTADSLDACALQYSAGDVLFFGMTSGYTDQSYGIITGASQYMYLSIASAFYIHLEASEVRMTHPVVGDDTEFACHGAIDSAMTDADYTVPANEYKYYTISFLGVTGGTTRTVTFPHPSSLARSYSKNIICSTEKAIIVSTGTGTTVTITASYARVLEFTNAGVRGIGPEYDPT